MASNDIEYPEHYVDSAHPDDYRHHTAAHPPPPECIMVRREGRHTRLLLRIAWRIPPPHADSELLPSFLPMTFTLNTGAPLPMYLCRRARQALRGVGLLHADSFGGPEFVRLAGHCLVPEPHDTGNVIGLPLLARWELCLHRPTASSTATTLAAAFHFACSPPLVTLDPHPPQQQTQTATVATVAAPSCSADAPPAHVTGQDRCGGGGAHNRGDRRRAHRRDRRDLKRFRDELLQDLDLA